MLKNARTALELTHDQPLVMPAKAQDRPGNRGRLRGSDPVQARRIAVAGLGPAIPVFGADIMAGSRRGCPGRAPGKGLFEPKLAAKRSDELPFDFPRKALRESEKPSVSPTYGFRLFASLRPE
jgi:hypothetical protein